MIKRSHATAFVFGKNVIVEGRFAHLGVAKHQNFGIILNEILSVTHCNGGMMDYYTVEKLNIRKFYYVCVWGY